MHSSLFLVLIYKTVTHPQRYRKTESIQQESILYFCLSEISTAKSLHQLIVGIAGQTVQGQNYTV